MDLSGLKPRYQQGSVFLWRLSGTVCFLASSSFQSLLHFLALVLLPSSKSANGPVFLIVFHSHIVSSASVFSLLRTLAITLGPLYNRRYSPCCKVSQLATLIPLFHIA